MAQKSFGWTYQMLMQLFEPDPCRSEQALQIILRLLSGPDPPDAGETPLQTRTNCDIVDANESPSNEPLKTAESR